MSAPEDSGAGRDEYISIGMDSPVMADWLTKKSFAARIRTSAGMIDPAVSAKTSPGATSWIGTASSAPSRRTITVDWISVWSFSAARLEAHFLDEGEEYAEENHSPHHGRGPGIPHEKRNRADDEQLDDERILQVV